MYLHYHYSSAINHSIFYCFVNMYIQYIYNIYSYILLCSTVMENTKEDIALQQAKFHESTT